MSEPIKFPGWFYGPNGEAQIFDREEDVPEGWKDHPSKFAKAESEAAAPDSSGKLSTEGGAATPVSASNKSKRGKGKNKGKAKGKKEEKKAESEAAAKVKTDVVESPAAETPEEPGTVEEAPIAEENVQGEE